jgi:hypothetical protein
MDRERLSGGDRDRADWRDPWPLEKARCSAPPRTRADAMAFARRVLSDRHQFHLVVTPEDAAEMTDPTAFTPDLAARWTAISAPDWPPWHRALKHRQPACASVGAGVEDAARSLHLARLHQPGLRSRGRPGLREWVPSPSMTSDPASSRRRKRSSHRPPS